MGEFIRLVPDEPLALSLERGKEEANRAYSRARSAQRTLLTSSPLIELLWRPGPVSYARLRGEIGEARRQVDRANAVLAALEDARLALEATTRTIAATDREAP